MLNKYLTMVIGIILLAASVILINPHWIEFWAVDACLDSGGSFNYTAQECDLVQNHPYAPSYSKLSWSVVTAAVLSLVGLVLLFISRDNPKGNEL